MLVSKHKLSDAENLARFASKRGENQITKRRQRFEGIEIQNERLYLYDKNAVLLGYIGYNASATAILFYPEGTGLIIGDVAPNATDFVRIRAPGTLASYFTAAGPLSVTTTDSGIGLTLATVNPSTGRIQITTYDGDIILTAGSGHAVKVGANEVLTTASSLLALTTTQTEVYSGDTPSSSAWTDLDLSSTIGANKALVLLKFCETEAGTNYRFAVRANGDGDALYQSGSNGANIADCGTTNYFSTAICATDTSGVIEWYASDTSKACTIDLIAYIK